MGEEPVDVVVGQGALGTAFAAALGRRRPVRVVSRRADEPRKARLALEGESADAAADVEVAPEPPERARLVVLATRSDEALERAREVEPALVDEGGAIAPVQNGLTSLEVARGLDTEQVTPTVVGFNAHLADPTTARLTSPGEVTVGAASPAARPGAQALAAALSGPLTVQQTDNPRGAVWSKWCVSCAINGLAVVAGDGVGAITRRRAGREALVAVLSECVELAEAREVETERVAGPLKPDTLAGNATSGLGGAFRRGVTWLIGRRYSDVTPSSVDALREGRDPELDALNGRAVELGDEVGVDTLWNRATIEIARAIVAGEREPGLANLEELRGRAQAAGT